MAKEGLKTVTVEVPTELALEFQRTCKSKHESMTKVMRELMITYIKVVLSNE